MWRPQITGQREPAPAPISPRWVLAPLPPPVEPGLGTLPCSARGCNETTAVACSQLDRCGRACPTAWCWAHRAVRDGRVLCPIHARADIEAMSAHAQLAAMSWVVRQVDAVITAAVQSVCDESGEQLIIEPVRLLTVGIDRVRTWERTWKSVSHRGISLRVQMAIAESEPDVVVARVSSHVVASAALPPAETRRRSDETGDESDPWLVSWREGITRAVIAAIASWQAIERTRPSNVVQLTGTAQRQRVAF